MPGSSDTIESDSDVKCGPADSFEGCSAGLRISLGGGLTCAAIAAFNTCAKAGAIPHATQGGMGKDSVAVVGSKFDGTGFGE